MRVESKRLRVASSTLKQEFIAYRMEEDFLTELQALIEEFEASLNSAVTATSTHIEATADIGVTHRTPAKIKRDLGQSARRIKR